LDILVRKKAGRVWRIGGDGGRRGDDVLEAMTGNVKFKVFEMASL
jgi:hypothetical protein